MRPPICGICDQWLSMADGTAFNIRFAVTDERQKQYNRDVSDGMPGHPYGLETFCFEHYGFAKKYKHLTWAEAKPLILEDIKNKPEDETAGKPTVWQRILYLFGK